MELSPSGRESFERIVQNLNEIMMYPYSGVLDDEDLDAIEEIYKHINLKLHNQ